MNREIPIDSILPSPTNPRRHFDEGSLAELAQSIRTKGVLQAILVRPAPGFRLTPGRESGKPGWFWENQPQRMLWGFHTDKAACEANPPYELVAGERRWRAARLAGLARIPATIRDLTDREVCEIQVIENEQRQDVSPLEKAEGYGRLVEQHKVSVEALAAQVGKSTSTIRDLLRLRVLPDAARQALEQGTLSASVAGLIARIPAATSREQCAQQVLAGRGYCHGRNDTQGPEPLSYRQTKSLIAESYVIELKGAPFSQKDATLVPGAGACTTCPNRCGNNREEYPDARADVCVDTACYRSKLDAHHVRQVEQAKQAGATVLSAEQAKKLFPYGSHLAHDAPYFDLGEQCWQDQKGGKAGRSYEKLLGKHLQPGDVQIVTDDRGRLRRLVHKDVALPVLRREHGLFEQTTGKRTSEEDRRERQKRLAESRLHAAIARETLGQVHLRSTLLFGALPPADPALNTVLRVLVQDALVSCWHDRREEVFARLGIRARTSQERVDEMNLRLDAMTGPQLLGLLVEVWAARHLLGGSSTDAGRRVEGALGIDRKRIEKQAREAAKATHARKKEAR